MGKNISDTLLYITISPTEVPFQYAEVLLSSFVIILASAFYYICYFRLSFSNFPFCNVDVFFFYCWITRRYIRESTSTSVAFSIFLSVCKYFEKEGICLIWAFKPLLFIYGEQYTKKFANESSLVDRPLFYDMLSDMVGKSILTNSGSMWKTHRKMLNPGFRFDVLRETIATLNEGAEDIVKKLTELGNKPTLEVLPVIKVGVLKILCASILGVKRNHKEYEEKLSQYAKMASSLSEFTVNRFLRPWLWWPHLLLLFQDGRKHRKMYREVRNFAEKMVKEMIKSNSISLNNGQSSEGIYNNSKSLPSILLGSHSKDNSFSMEDVVNEVQTFLFAGHDTTSYALLWCLFMFGHHPQIQERAFEEVELITENDDGHISYNDSTKLRYLESIIKETMRLYPVIPMFVRQARKEIEYEKYRVPKNTAIFFFSYLLHRNPEIYPDPEKFDPERFYEKSLKHPWAYIPFSEGIRSCIGKNFAMMKLKIILAHILRNFKITSLDKREDIVLDWKITLTPTVPILFKFTCRKSRILPQE